MNKFFCRFSFLALVLAVLAVCIFPVSFKAFASPATSSNADSSGENYEIMDLSFLLSYLENIDRCIADIHSSFVSDEISDSGQYSVLLSDDWEGSSFDLDSDFPIGRNVIIYNGFWGSESYRLVFPAEYEKYLIVTDDGYLYNLSGSSITGRFFKDTVDYESYTYSSFVLNSVLGNVASTIYNYGYPSYMRTYYVSSNRITYSDAYGLFRVDSIERTDSADPDRINGVYLLVLILIGGVNLLCSFKKSWK